MPTARATDIGPAVRRSLRVLSISAALVGGLSCGREVTGPGNGTRLVARNFAFALDFGAVAEFSGVASALVPFERVRITLDNSALERAVDRTINFPSTNDSIALALDVPLSEGTGVEGENFLLRIAFVNASGDTVFRSLPQLVLVRPNAPGQSPTIPTVQVVPTGPAANAASVLIAPRSASVISGDPFTFSAQALDGQGAPLADVPVGWVSLDTALARMPVLTSGDGTTRPGRGTARIVAVLPGGQSDTVTVSVAPRASLIEAVSGGAQTGPAGLPLSAPIVARVRATDGLPIEGVTVAFAAANGGNVSSGLVVTDANGLAQVSWTLGGGAGAQSATASVAGLTGSPVTFTATATASVATQLAFTVQPSSLPAGGTISPAVQVTARDVNGIAVSTFTEPVTIALGANPGGSTLGGTLTVNAVAGVATFSGLTVNNPGAGYTITAASTGLSGATSTSFDATLGVISWTNPAGGNWSVASNWSLNRVPVTTDSVVIDLAGSYSVTLDTTFVGSFITVGGASGAQTLSLSNRTLTVSGALSTQGSGSISASSAVLTGSGALLNAATGSVTLRSSSVSLAVLNAGSIDARANVTITGAVTTVAGSVLSVTGEGFQSNGVLIVNDGFTNNGSIRLDFVNTSGGQTSTLAVTNGILVNAAGGLIEATATSPSAVRFLNAQLMNLGTVQLHAEFTHNARGAGSNSGSILADAQTNVTLAFTGVTPTFVNSGTISLPSGRNWTTANTGTFVMASSSTFDGGGSYSANSGATTVLQMAPALAAVGSNGGTLTIGAGIVIGGGAMPLTNALVNGDGAVALPVGSASTWRNSIVTVPLQLDGTLDTRQSTTISGLITTSATSVLRVAGEGFQSNGALNVTSGLTNNGTVELDFVNTSGGQTTRLEVTGGTLVNAAGAIIRATSTSPTATRQLIATLDNQGSLVIDAVTFIGASGANVNAGNISIGAAGSVNVAFIGATPSLTHTGSIIIPSGRSWITSGTGTVTMAAASAVGGGGIYSSNSGATTVWQMAPTLESVGSDGGTITLAAGVTLSNMDIPLNAAGLNGDGAIVMSAGRSALWRNVTTALPVQLSGTLDFRGTSNFTGALTMDASGVLRVTGEGFQSNGILTIANGFTNPGTVELDFVNGAGGQFTRLQVTNGAIVNAPGGVLRTTANIPTAQRQLAAALDNQGSVIIDALTAVTATGANTSSGSITLGATGGMTFAFSGGGATFVQTGALTIPAGRSWITTGAGSYTFGPAASVTGGGSYTTASGATTVLQMVPALASFGADNGSITIESGVTLTALDVPLNASTVNGEGSLVLGTGRNVLWRNSTINVPVLLEGTLDVRGSTAVNAALSTTASAVLRVTGEGFASSAHLTVANGFTNNGIIDLDYTNTDGGQTTALTVSAGTLVNAAGAQLRSTGTSPSALRSLNASLDNQGSITIDALTAFNLRGTNVNAGSIALSTSGTMTLGFGAESPTFSHNGTLTIPSGRSWTTTGAGTFTMASPSTVSGGGTYTSNGGAITVVDVLPVLGSMGSNGGTLTLGAAANLANMSVPLASAVVNGAGSIEVSSGQSMLWRSSTIAVPVQISGTLDTRGNTTISGAITTGSSALWRVTGEGFASNALVTSSFGFTNNGTIEIDFVNGAGGQESRLVMDSGTLTNAATGTIRTTDGVPTAARFLQGTVSNQGSIEIGAVSTMVLVGTSSNTGSISVGSTGTVTLVMIGGATLNNTGALSLPAGRTWTTIGNGAVNLNAGGTFTGGGSYTSNSGAVTAFQIVPTLAAVGSDGGNLNVASGVTLSGLAINLNNAILGGAGSVLLSAGSSSLWRGSSISLPVSLAGTLDVRGATNLTGALTTVAGSVLRVTGEGFSSSGILTVSSGFTNNGLLELDYANTNGGQITRLIVSSGSLVNAATGTLRATSNTPTAGRFLEAALDNQGLLELFPGAAGTLAHTGSLVSSGTITASLGGLAAGTEYGRMTVSGTAIVGGTLTVGLFGGFTPASGNTFDIITSSGLLSGGFANATLNGVSIIPSILSNAVRVTAP